VTTNRLEAFSDGCSPLRSPSWSSRSTHPRSTRVDGPLLVLNLLLWTALIPFPTAVVAEYLQAGGELAQTAVALYGAVFLLVGLSFGGLFAWVTRDDRLLGQLLPREVVRSTRLPGSASTVRSHGSGGSAAPGRPREV